jgi:hypothetical protein
MTSTATTCDFLKKSSKKLNKDNIIETLDQAEALELHYLMVNSNIDIFKCPMKNLFLISRVWKTWRKSGGPAAQIRVRYK